MAEKLRVGVWVENGVVFRRESQKCPNARTYTPRSPKMLEEVLDTVRRLQSYSEMSNWTAQIEHEVYLETESLKSIATF